MFLGVRPTRLPPLAAAAAAAAAGAGAAVSLASLLDVVDVDALSEVEPVGVVCTHRRVMTRSRSHDRTGVACAASSLASIASRSTCASRNALTAASSCA
jgi:hypothetical protein